MNDQQLLEIILDEQAFPYHGLSLKERNYYLNIIRNCKDIKDSKYKVGNTGECKILGLSFRKEDSIIRINGFLNLGIENRCIDGYIYLGNSQIVVDMHITRLCIQDGDSEYQVLDIFKLKDSVLENESYYNFNYDNYIKKVEKRGRKK